MEPAAAWGIASAALIGTGFTTTRGALKPRPGEFTEGAFLRLVEAHGPRGPAIEQLDPAARTVRVGADAVDAEQAFWQVARNSLQDVDFMLRDPGSGRITGANQAVVDAISSHMTRSHSSRGVSVGLGLAIAGVIAGGVGVSSLKRSG
jgi:hypothetical protein